MALKASSGREDEAWLKVMQVISVNLVPMAMKAAIELNVMGILAEHAEQSASAEPSFLTAAQIASHFVVDPSSNNPSFDHERASTSLDRTLRVLASHGLLSSSLLVNPPPQPPTRSYGLNACSRYFLPGHGSLAPLLLLHQAPAVSKAPAFLQDAILHGIVPFDQANGMPLFSYAHQDARFHSTFYRAMENHSELFTQALLDSYDGFKGITSLVDVGGGVGASLAAIVSKHTHIKKGINLDLPHVVASAPAYPGVTHVGGDMLKEIPQADAVFVKSTFHNWGDADCLTIMKNCYKALPSRGKVIVVEAVLPVAVESEPDVRCQYLLDLLMLSCFQGARERTKVEWDALSKASGFASLQVVCSLGASNVMEIYKDAST